MQPQWSCLLGSLGGRPGNLVLGYLAPPLPAPLPPASGVGAGAGGSVGAAHEDWSTSRGSGEEQALALFLAFCLD